MRPLKRVRALALGLLASGALACSCSGSDVSLGEDLHPTPQPSFTPTPIPVPIPIPVPAPIPSPTPTPTEACELEHKGTCLVSTEPCSGGRFVTQTGYECGVGTTCCVVSVGMGAPGSGGTSNMDTTAGGVGGQ
jgi:hypothetical protein